MSSLTIGEGLVHLGMDTSKDAIVVGILRPGQQLPDVERIFNDDASVRRLIGRFDDPARLRACYEAGPGGYGLHRLLSSLGVACQVVAPSLVPKGSRDRVKTDRRDAVRLARLHRAGELTAIRVPSAQEEAIRDLVRVRADLVADLKRAKQRLLAMLLRHGTVWRAGDYWTIAHRQWIAGLVFDDPALQQTVDHYRATWTAREAEVAAINTTLTPWADREPFGEQVARLTAYRGIGILTALTLASEIVDWRRFPCARSFMCFTGLVPSEYSSGQATRRGHITKAGPAATRSLLVEAAWKCGNIGTGPRSAPDYAPATATCPPTSARPPSPGPGRPSSGCTPNTGS
jgi:transposase